MSTFASAAGTSSLPTSTHWPCRTPSLLFTYPPFAALLFAPWQRVFSTVHSVQIVWTTGNLAALVAMLVLSLRIVKPEIDRKTSLALRPAAQPSHFAPQSRARHGWFRSGQPGGDAPRHVGLAELAPNRATAGTVGRRHRARRRSQADSAPLRAVPPPHAALPRRAQLHAHLPGVRARDLCDLARLVEGILDASPVQARSCRRALLRRQPELVGCPRTPQPRLSGQHRHAPHPPRRGRWRTLVGQRGAPAVIADVGCTHLRRNVPAGVAHLVGSPHGVGRARHPLAGSGR